MIIFNRKRDKRAWGEDGERQAEESEKTPDNILQLPAGRPAKAVSEHTVSGAAGESRAGCLAGTHANTSEIFGSNSCFLHFETVFNVLNVLMPLNSNKYYFGELCFCAYLRTARL